MTAPDGLCGPGFSAWLEPRSGEQVIEIDPGTGCYTLDVADWGVAGPAARRRRTMVWWSAAVRAPGWAASRASIAPPRPA